jgi:PAS domain S-box-containing protein
MLFAQNGGTPGGVVGALITAFMVVLGLMGWVLRELIAKTIPDLTKGSVANTKAMLETFTAVNEADRKQYREDIRSEREACDKRVKEQTQEVMGGIERQARDRTDAMNLLRSIQQTLTLSTRLSALVTQADEPIWTKSPDGIMTSWNRAAHQLLGWRTEEIVGRSVFEITPPDLHEAERLVLERIRRGEKVDRYRTERFHRDGHRVVMEVAISPVRDATGKVVSIGSFAREAAS